MGHAMSAASSSVAEGALRAVLAATNLPEAHVAARDGLDAIVPHNLLTRDEAEELSGWSAGHLRKQIAKHRLGIKRGERWFVFRDRLFLRLKGGA